MSHIAGRPPFQTPALADRRLLMQPSLQCCLSKRLVSIAGKAHCKLQKHTNKHMKRSGKHFVQCGQYETTACKSAIVTLCEFPAPTGTASRTPTMHSRAATSRKNSLTARLTRRWRATR